MEEYIIYQKDSEKIGLRVMVGKNNTRLYQLYWENDNYFGYHFFIPIELQALKKFMNEFKIQDGE